jgi:hypothetical protein
MRKSFAKALVKEFKARFPERFPGFPEVPKSQRTRGGVLCSRRPRNVYTGFVYLQLHDARDVFTIEIAGSTGDVFPWECVGSAPAWEEKGKPIFACRDAPPRPRFRIRLSELWPPNNDFWWGVSSFKEPDIGDNEAWEAYIFDDAVEDKIEPDLIDQSLDDVFQKLAEYGMPYFEAVARAAEKRGFVR